MRLRDSNDAFSLPHRGGKSFMILVHCQVLKALTFRDKLTLPTL